jgi:hypothetical protein
MRHNNRHSPIEALALLFGSAVIASQQASKDKRRKRLQRRHLGKTWNGGV